MYAHLSGTVAGLGADHAVIDCHGVGYLAFCSTRSLGRLQTGQNTFLHTRLVVREDALILYGFADTAERDLFDLVTTVSGVGPRLALSLLSSFAPEEFAGAVRHNQPATLARASGVGKKLAEKIIVELKDKLGSIPLFSAAQTPAHGATLTDLASALINLGYQPKAAEAAATAVVQEFPHAPFEELFRTALKRVA